MAIWANRPAASLPKGVVLEIRALSESVDSLETYIDAAQSQSPAESPSTVIKGISEQLNVPIETLRPIFNALENLKGLSDEFGNADQAIEEVANHLDEENAVLLRAAKEKISSAVSRYLNDNSVSTAYKAQKLTYLRENVYQDAEIVTDVRPVFNNDGGQVVEFLVTHYLVANYFKSGRNENIHLAMDIADLIKLRRLCDRAIVKSETLKKELGEKAKILRDDNAAS